MRWVARSQPRLRDRAQRLAAGRRDGRERGSGECWRRIDPQQGGGRQSQFLLPEPDFNKTEDIRNYCNAIRALMSQLAIEMAMASKILEARLSQAHAVPGENPDLVFGCHAIWITMNGIYINENLDTEALEEMRMLSNINADKNQFLQLILVGQPTLRETLRRPEMHQFAQRIAVDVEDGVVTLRGTLPSHEEVRYATDDAWEVAGVRGVKSEIVVEEGRSE